MDETVARRTIADLHRRIDEQQQTIDQLRTTVEELGSSIRALAAPGPTSPGHIAAPVTSGPPAAADPVGPATTDPTASSATPVPTTDRRRLLGGAARVAAGAVAGGTAVVLGSASPAAAAPGTFDGNPAVTATNTGGAAGKAVLATGGAGIGVDCTSSTGTLGQAALRATYSGTNSTIGAADLTGGFGAALRAFNNSASATLVVGNNAVDGNPYAFAGGALFASSAGDTLSAQSSSPRASGTAALRAEGFTNSNGISAMANESGSGALVSGGRCDLHVGSEALLAKAPSARRHDNGHAVGELALDASTGNLFMCVLAAPAGQVGTWRKITGPATAGALHVLPTPVRVYDSRPGNPPVAVGPKTPLAAATARTCDLKANSSGVPAGATAVLVSLVATGTTGALGGFLSIYRNGIAWPGTSSLNWSGPGQNVAVTTVTAVDASAVCNLFANVVTDVVVDVLGFYQ